MEKGLNFRTQPGQADYFRVYDRSLQLWNVPYTERCVDTSFGKTHCLVSGDPSAPPLVLLHASSCGATIWYPNVAALGQRYCVYAPDLITESSKSVLASRIRTPEQCAGWLNETLDGLGLNQVYLCGLSIGGWHAANYAMHYPGRVKKLVLLSPIQTLARMHPWFFLKIMRMGFHPTRANVEKYIGWGRANEAPLPESVIEQFTISVLNINPNAAFPRMIKRQSLRALEMPVMVLLGENEYSFDVGRALSVAEVMIRNATVEVIPGASHLISVSRPDIVNGKVLDFLRE